MKKGIGILIFVLAISAVAVFWFVYQGRPLLPIEDAEETVLDFNGQEFFVLYTDKGYEPDILEIPLGSKVTFKNQAVIPMWTASDPHPQHSDFFAFDSFKSLGFEEEYSFIFTRTGTFGYHNHIKSLHRGIVKVSNAQNPLPNIDKTKESQRAVRDKFIAMLDPKNPETVFTLIDKIEADTALARDCHDMAHDLGHKAYEMFGFSTAMTLSSPTRPSHTSVDDICAGGYMHGILEELFLNRPELKDNPNEACAFVPGFNRDSCFHGVGHGLMFVNKRSVPLSLSACRRLQTPTDTYRCFEGVWMEMFWGEVTHAGADSLGWTVEEPLTPCVLAKEDEKPTCFLYAHLGYLRTHPRDFTGAINLCTQSGLIDTDRRFCLKGVGITMMKHFTSRGLTLTEGLVYGLPYDDKYAYYAGVVGYSRLSAVSESSLTVFCSSLKNDTKVCKEVLKNEPK